MTYKETRKQSTIERITENNIKAQFYLGNGDTVNVYTPDILKTVENGQNTVVGVDSKNNPFIVHLVYDVDYDKITGYCAMGIEKRHYGYFMRCEVKTLRNHSSYFYGDDRRYYYLMLPKNMDLGTGKKYIVRDMINIHNYDDGICYQLSMKCL